MQLTELQEQYWQKISALRPNSWAYGSWSPLSLLFLQETSVLISSGGHLVFGWPLKGPSSSTYLLFGTTQVT